MNKGHISREELLAGVEKYKSHIYMPRWLEGADQLSLDVPESAWPCNTAFCVGALTCLLAGDTVQYDDVWATVEAVDQDGKQWEISERAAELLDLPNHDLFFPKFWEKDLHDAFYNADIDAPERQEHALSIIRSAIERYVPA
jgi:hypothetical protein